MTGTPIHCCQAKGLKGQLCLRQFKVKDSQERDESSSLNISYEQMDWNRMTDQIGTFEDLPDLQ